MAGGGSAELRELRKRVDLMAEALKRMQSVIAGLRVRLDELEAQKAPEVKVMPTKVKAKPRRRPRRSTRDASQPRGGTRDASQPRGGTRDASQKAVK